MKRIKLYTDPNHPAMREINEAYQKGMAECRKRKGCDLLREDPHKKLVESVAEKERPQEG